MTSQHRHQSKVVPGSGVTAAPSAVASAQSLHSKKIIQIIQSPLLPARLEIKTLKASTLVAAWGRARPWPFQELPPARGDPQSKARPSAGPQQLSTAVRGSKHKVWQGASTDSENCSVSVFTKTDTQEISLDPILLPHHSLTWGDSSRLDSTASNPIISARTACLFKSVSLNLTETSADSLHQLPLLWTLSLQIPQHTHSDACVVQAPQSQKKFSYSVRVAEGMVNAQRLLLNVENNFISLFQLLLLKDRHIWAVPTPSPTLWELILPLGAATLGYGKKEGALDLQPQPLLQGSKAVRRQNFSSTLLELLFFLVERAGWAVKWRVFTRLGHSASSQRFTDRREISRPCPTPAGQQPAQNWKPSNNTLRPCTGLEMRMLISASHFSVIQEWSRHFLFFFLLLLFSFFSSSSFPFFPLFLPPFQFGFLKIILFSPFFQVTKPLRAVIFL